MAGQPMARARSLTGFQEAFPDEASCAAFLFERRWPDGFVSPVCGKGRAALTRRPRPGGRMPACSMARAAARAMAGSIGPRRPSPNSPARSRTPITPVSSALPGLPRNTTRFAVPGSMAGAWRMADKKMKGSIQGAPPRGAPPPAERLLAAKDRCEALGLAVSQGQWVACRYRTAVSHPDPGVSVTAYGARTGLDLNEHETIR